MRIGLTIAAACLGIVAAAGVLWAGAATTDSDGLPGMDGFYAGTIKLTYLDQTGGESGKQKQKLDFLLAVNQFDTSNLSAEAQIGNLSFPVKGSHDANAFLEMSGAAGGGSFFLCTPPGDNPELFITGTVKVKKSGKIKLKATGAYVSVNPTVAGSATVKATHDPDAVLFKR